PRRLRPGRAPRGSGPGASSRRWWAALRRPPPRRRRVRWSWVQPRPARVIGQEAARPGPLAHSACTTLERMFDAAVLDGLNEQQRAAATHTGGPLRVLAGPGTGKTTTLTARVAWLVASGVQAERVLLLT